MVLSDVEPVPKTVDPPTIKILNVSSGFSKDISSPLNPKELISMVKAIRSTEVILGKSKKLPRSA